MSGKRTKKRGKKTEFLDLWHSGCLCVSLFDLLDWSSWVRFRDVCKDVHSRSQSTPERFLPRSSDLSSFLGWVSVEMIRKGECESVRAVGSNIGLCFHQRWWLWWDLSTYPLHPTKSICVLNNLDFSLASEISVPPFWQPSLLELATHDPHQLLYKFVSDALKEHKRAADVDGSIFDFINDRFPFDPQTSIPSSF
jgi:hypothetical protein